MHAYEVASLALLPYKHQCARVRNPFAVTLCACYNTENTWSTTQLTPFSCAISARFKFCIPAVVVFFIPSIVALVEISHIMRFGFVNEQPNFHIRIHVQSLSAPLSEFSPIPYPCLLSLDLINRFDPDVLTFCTAINFMGNIYLYTQRLKFMILLRTSGKPEVLYSLCIHHYLLPMYVNLKPHLIHGDITATFTSLFA